MPFLDRLPLTKYLTLGTLGLVLWYSFTFQNVQTQGWPDFQAHGQDFMMFGDETAGLGFQVSLREEWPQILKSVEKTIVHMGQGDTILHPSFNLGSISTSEVSNAGYSLFEKDWAHVGISITPGLSLYVSRLTPAVVVTSTEQSLTLFGGGVPQPAYLATPDSLVSRDQLDSLPLGDLDSSWLLVWFGEEAGFEATNFPWHAEFVFHSPVYPADLPLLMLFQNTPSSLEAMDEEGLVVSFPSQAGGIAILPLFGDQYPLLSETDRWVTDGLSQDVIQQANWWAAHHSQIPLSATETYSYDEHTDTVSLTMQVNYFYLRDRGTLFAPLPPMLAVAEQTGFPLQLSGDLVPTSVLTEFGPYVGIEGVDQYTYGVAGLGKYVQQTSRGGTAQFPSPEWLTQKLRKEIQSIIHAGHLAPWYPATNGFNLYWFNKGILTWSNPGEMLSILSETLPLLDSSLQTDLLNYLHAERTNYPPETIAVLPADEGARRERWRLDSEEVSSVIARHNECVAGINHYEVNDLIPEENLYYLAEYARHTGVDTIVQQWSQLRQILYPYFYRQDWATLGWYKWPKGDSRACGHGNRTGEFNGQGGIVDANHHFAAMVGALRLASWAEDTDGLPFLWGQFARSAILRYAMEQYGEYRYDSGLDVLPTEPDWLDTFGRIMYTRHGDGSTIVPFESRASYISGQDDWMVRYLEGAWAGHLYTYHWTDPDDDMRSVAELDQFRVRFDDLIHPFYGKGLLPYRGIVPELGSFLADQQKSVSWARAFVDRVAENIPDWYHALGRQALGQENNYLYPEAAHQIFMARAWILQESPTTLASFLDVPWMGRGDLYYIQKLTEVIMAYGVQMTNQVYLPLIVRELE